MSHGAHTDSSLARDAHAPLAPSHGSAAGLNAFLDAHDLEWKEATEAAEAWCNTKDPYRRDREIYCYRAGYLKAKRQNDKVSDTAT